MTMQAASADEVFRGARPIVEREERLNVLCIDYGVGFGGATKSTGLMLAYLSNVNFRVLTSQDPEIREKWYGNVPVGTFRRLVSYHTKGQFAQWLERRVRPAILRKLCMKLFAVADVGTTLWNAARISIMVVRNRINLIHLVNGYVPAEGIWASALTGVPCIANMRGFWISEDPLLPPLTRRNTWLVGDSLAVTDSVPPSWCSPDRRRTIYEAVDVASIERSAGERRAIRARHGISDGALLFAIMGRVVPWKGQMEFVRAMIEAMSQDDRLVGMIVGDGPSPYMDAVRAAIEESGFNDRFVLTGYTADVEPYYDAADAIVHASIEPEPCGMVVLEGMAARRPVIAAKAGGPVELLRDGTDGVLVPPGDVEALRDALLHLAAEPELRASMGEHGHERARLVFDAPIIAAAYEKLYSELTTQLPDPAVSSG